MPGWDMSSYEPVADRIERFYIEHPGGRIITQILPSPEGTWLVRADVYREENKTEDTFGLCCATGHAQERVSSSGVNSTSALENCETSAIGRALANLGYAAKGAGSRPSREEMTKTQAGAPVSADAIATMSPSAIGRELAARGLEPGGAVDDMRARLRKAIEADEPLLPGPKDYPALTKNELIAECVNRTPPLDSDGSKDVLIARLIADDARMQEPFV